MDGISSCDLNEEFFTTNCDSCITIETGVNSYCEWKIHNIQNKCYVVKWIYGDNVNYISIFLISYNDNQLKKKLVCDGSFTPAMLTDSNLNEVIECSGNCSFFNSFLKYHY